MSRRLRATISTQQFREEQINFLLEVVEKNLDEYKKAFEIKDKNLEQLDFQILENGSEREIPPTFSPYEIYQYANTMLNHLPAQALKTIEKTHLYSKQPVYYADVGLDRRKHNRYKINTTGSNDAQIASLKAAHAKDLNIDGRIKKFQNQLKSEHVYRIL